MTNKSIADEEISSSLFSTKLKETLIDEHLIIKDEVIVAM